MTRDDIIRMAREASGYISELPNGDAWLFDDAALERFAAIVAAAEREKCAEICDNSAKWSELAYALAAAIRARGQ